MAACEGLEHILEKSLPDDPTLNPPLSPWKQIKTAKDVHNSSFPELFGELHVKANHDSSSSSSPFPQSSPNSFSSYGSTLTAEIYPIDIRNRDEKERSIIHQEKSFGSSNYQEFHEDLSRDDFYKNEHRQQRKGFRRNMHCCIENGSGGGFPPPISCIGRSGKPWVCFKSYKQNGRFVLKEIRIPTQELLHARRENGRLKLTIIHSESDDDFFGDDEEDEDDCENNEI